MSHSFSYLLSFIPLSYLCKDILSVSLLFLLKQLKKPVGASAQVTPLEKMADAGEVIKTISQFKISGWDGLKEDQITVQSIG